MQIRYFQFANLRNLFAPRKPRHPLLRVALGLLAVAILAVLHFYWMRAGKNDFAEVLVYGVLLAMLLGWRVWHQWRRRRIEAAQRHAVSVH